MMLVLSLAITNVVALRRTTCTTDEDCLSDARTYCYEARECVKCLDCSIFLRDPGSKTCAKEKSDCGPCKAGFLAEENIDGSPGHCIKQNIDNKPSDNNNTSHVTDKPNYLMIVLIFMFVFLLFIFAWAEWRYRFCMPIHDEGIISRLSMIFRSNSNNLNTTCPTKEPSAPPLPPPYEEPITNEIQRANMFQTPCYVVGNQ